MWAREGGLASETTFYLLTRLSSLPILQTESRGTVQYSVRIEALQYNTINLAINCCIEETQPNSGKNSVRASILTRHSFQA